MGKDPRQEGKGPLETGWKLSFVELQETEERFSGGSKERIPPWNRGEGSIMGLSHMRVDGDVWKIQSGNCERIRHQQCLVGARKRVVSMGQPPWGNVNMISVFLSPSNN